MAIDILKQLKQRLLQTSEDVFGTAERPTAIRQFPETLKTTTETRSWMPEPLKRATEFISPTPKSEEEAISMGLVNIGTKEKPVYFDITGGIGGVTKGAGKEVLKKIAPKIERGFVTSAKKIIPEAEKIAGQYIPRETDKLAIKAKNLIKSQIDIAERIATTQTDDSAVAIASELIKHYGDEAAKAKDIMTKNVLYERAADVANNMARKLTELGRSVQAASILGRLTPEGQVRFAAKEIQKYNEAIDSTKGGILGLRKKIPELTAEQTDSIITEMKAIEQMANGTEKAIRFQKLQNYIADFIPSSTFQKIISVWKAGLLTGVKTSGLNIFSNVSHFGTETIKDIPAVAVDSVVSLFTKQRTLAPTLKGIMTGVREGFGKGVQYLKTGFDERNVGQKLDWKRVNFGKGKVAKGLQKYEETIFRIIGSEDQPFYYGAKARSLYDQATAKSLNQGLKGGAKQKFIENLVQNPTDDMVHYAVLDAETAVYQNATGLGKVAKGIQKLGGGIGEVIVPFGRTPSAVAMQIINYSPVGIVKTIVENIGKGKFDQRLFSQGIGRGITGTSALYLGQKLFDKNLINLDRPKTEKEQKLWEIEGRQPNTIKLGDKWRSAQILGPMGNLLLVGAHFKNEFKKSGSATEAFSNAVAGSAKSFTEQTFLKGINQVVSAINDPSGFAEGYLGSTISSVIPTIVSDFARAFDRIERRATTIPERLQARVPVLRGKLEPQITILGKEKPSTGNVLEIMADPTRPSKETKTPLISEFRRLWDLDYKVSPTLLGDKKGYPSLTKEQNTQLWKRVGEITESKLNNLIASERYQKLPDDVKAKTIKNFVEKAKVVARAEAAINLTQDLRGDELKNKLSELKKSGLLTRDVWNKYIELR
mgnify:CR=1 FL=1